MLRNIQFYIMLFPKIRFTKRLKSCQILIFQSCLDNRSCMVNDHCKNNTFDKKRNKHEANTNKVEFF